MQRGAFLRNPPIAVALFVDRGDIGSEIEQVPNAFGIADASELAEQLPRVLPQLVDQARFVRDNGTNLVRVVSGASRQQLVETLENDRQASPCERSSTSPRPSRAAIEAAERPWPDRLGSTP